MAEQKISPGLVIVGGLGLGLVGVLAIAALAGAAAAKVKYRIELGNEPFGAGGIAMRQPEDFRLTFDEGETVVLEAVPRDGYHFVGWLLDGALWSTDNPLTFTMDPLTMAPEVRHSIVATYVPI